MPTPRWLDRNTPPPGDWVPTGDPASTDPDYDARGYHERDWACIRCGSTNGPPWVREGQPELCMDCRKIADECARHGLVSALGIDEADEYGDGGGYPAPEETP